MNADEIKLKAERALTCESADALALLRRIHAEFPLPGSGMPDTFKGAHSLTLMDGKLAVNIWAEGQCWVVTDDA